MTTFLFSCPVQGRSVKLHLETFAISGIGSAATSLTLDYECSAEDSCSTRYLPQCRCRQLNQGEEP